jgi:RNA 3'-terminal phosphate cyclase (ATP)
LRSRQFTFHPGAVRAGDYSFDVGTAGSTTLVLQTIALPLALTAGDSHVTIIGGTHNPMAPCYEYLERVWAPLLGQLGVQLELKLKRAGFYPAGGGQIEARIRGIETALRPCNILERGTMGAVEGFSVVARLPRSIAERQAQRAESLLDAAGIPHLPVILSQVDAASPGTVLLLVCRSEATPAAFFGLGARGKPAERVAEEAVEQLVDYWGSGAALDSHAADQLILPLALAHGTSSFTTTRITEHLRTHADVLRQFLGRCIQLDEPADSVPMVSVS